MEAVAINLAGVGTLCAIIAPKILRAKQELEGKSLVGPSAVVANNSNIDSSCNGEVLFAGDALGSSRRLDSMPRALSRHSSGGGGDGISNNSGHTVTVGVFRKQVAAASAAAAAAAAASSDVCPDLEGSPPSVDPCVDPKCSADDGKRDARQCESTVGAVNGGSYMPVTGGNFSSSGGGGSKGLIVPDPAGFWTPPRHIRRAQSSAEVITRTKDGMALAAAASAAMTAAAGGGDTFGEKNRQLSQSGRGGRNSSSTASLSAERNSGHAISLPAKLPPSGASGSSRASRFSRASSIGGGGYGNRSNKTSHSRSHSTSNSAGRISSGDYSSSLLSSTDGWNVDPLMLAVNGFGWGGGGGGNGGVGGGSSNLRQSIGGGSSSSRRKSGIAAAGGAASGGGRRSGIWSSGGVGSLRRGSSREREVSVGSSASAGRRSNVAGCLVMHADTGTRLHCPHCDKEVRELQLIRERYIREGGRGEISLFITTTCFILLKGNTYILCLFKRIILSIVAIWNMVFSRTEVTVFQNYCDKTGDSIHLR